MRGSKVIEGNILVVGSPTGGKHTIVNLISENLETENQSKCYSYLMDYSFSQVNTGMKHGKTKIAYLHNHIINKSFDELFEFIDASIMNNLLILLVLDLNNCEKLLEEANEWISFLRKIFQTKMNSFPEEVKSKILSNIERIRNQIEKFGIFSSENDSAGLREKNEIKEVSENSDSESDSDTDNEINFPIFIIGNKIDIIDKPEFEQKSEKMLYDLRTMNIDSEGVVMTMSTKNNSGVDLLKQLIEYVLFDIKTRSNVGAENYQLNNLFIKSSSDSTERLCKDYFNQMSKFLKNIIASNKQIDNSKEVESVQSIKEFLYQLSIKHPIIQTDSKATNVDKSETVKKQNATEETMSLRNKIVNKLKELHK